MRFTKKYEIEINDEKMAYYYVLANNKFRYDSRVSAIQILGKIEDLMEKYEIPDIDYLEKCLIFHDKYAEKFDFNKDLRGEYK